MNLKVDRILLLIFHLYFLVCQRFKMLYLQVNKEGIKEQRQIEKGLFMPYVLVAIATM